MRTQIKRDNKNKTERKSQECLVRIVPLGRERKRVLPLVLPDPRRPNLEGIASRGHRKRYVKNRTEQNMSEKSETKEAHIMH